MTTLDWTLVIGLNGAIIVNALWGARRAEASSDWFLGGRSVPWWIVGLSAFATAIDSSDLVADSGGVYTLGMSYFATNWIGTVTGWVLLGNFVALPMYRAGMYTNSEYLEVRFGPTARVLSSLVQVQYRTMVLANIATTLFLTFAVVAGLGDFAWVVVGVVILLSISYTIIGGSRSVAFTDAALAIVTITASLVLFAVVWSTVGGWQGIEQKLTSHDPTLPGRMLHVGGDRIESIDMRGQPEQTVVRQLLLGGAYDREKQTITRQTPAWLVCLSFVLVGMAYAIVNHEQSMRLFAARSAWDMRMSVVVASLLLIGITFFNLMMGVMGRALFPSRDLLPVDESLRQTADTIYPVLVRDFTTSGFRGIVIAGLLAAATSATAGMSAAMSALLTRDVYARLIARNRDDHHYTVAGRWFTVAVVLGSLLYVPVLLKQGMMMFYLSLVSAFVAPLLTVFLMGVFTRVHRKSGAIGLLVGMSYGVWRLTAEKLALDYGIAIMPVSMMNSFAAYPISVMITAGTMLLVTLLLGWESRGQLLHEEAGGWLRQSQLRAQHIDSTIDQKSTSALPLVLGLAVIGLGMVLSFLVFW